MGLKSIALAATILLTPLASSATNLDFNDPDNLGVDLIWGNMTWNGDGGGHLYNNNYIDDGFIYFFTDTYVNSFEMNARPSDTNTNGDYGSILIAGFSAPCGGLCSPSEMLWSTTVDLSNYSTWDNWLTVDVETAGITYLRFAAPGGAPYYNGFWPSIDNMVINESPPQVPVPAATWLFGSGLIGLFGIARRKKK